MSEEEVVTNCESCGDEIPVSESESCEHCGLDPLCSSCIGDLDHECIEEEEGE